MMTTEQKLDRILLIIEGEPHSPGLMARIEDVEVELRGHAGSMGLVHKVNLMWRAHIWIVGGLGTIIGSALTLAVSHIK